MKKIITFALLLITGLLSATIINIPADFSGIQDGIDVAATGDTVLVAPGIYTGSISVTEKRITLASHLLTTGNDIYVEQTTIMGSGGSVINLSSADSTKLIGFSITGGNSTNQGGGVMSDSSSTVTLSDLIIYNNHVTHRGGGVYCNDYAILSNVIITGNSASYSGGGIYCNSATISNVTITDNSASDGGGIYIGGGIDFVSVYNSLITDNSATDPNNTGDGVVVNNTDLTLANTTIANNDAIGLRINSGSNTNINNCIVWNNGINVYANTSSNTSSLVVSYCDIDGGIESIISIGHSIITATGVNIFDDPNFVDPENGDYHLVANSPCIDAGNPYSPFDPDGTISDMGAFYYNQLQAEFSISVNTGYSPLSVIFTDETILTTTSWEWDFENDGIIDSYEQNPTHTYYVRDSYSVSLTVIDSVHNHQNTLLQEDLITVLNSQPIVQNPIVDFSFGENETYTSLDLNTIFDDVDLSYGDVLSFSYEGNTNIQVEIEDGIVTLNSISDWFGTENITFIANDDELSSISDEVTITVNPQNDSPILNITGTFTFDEDSYSQSYDFSEYCTQTFGETDQLTLSADNSEHIDVTVTNLEVIFEATTENWFGTEEITFYLDDNVSDVTRNNRRRNSVSQTISVIIDPVNDPHSFILPDSFSFLEDQEFVQDFSGYVNDIEGGDFIFSVSGNTNISVNIIGDIVTFSAIENWNGAEILTFTATDNENQYVVADEIIINVTSQNDAPSIILPTEISFAEDTQLAVDFNIYITDIDEDDLTLSVSGNIEIEVTIGGAGVLFTAPENWYGNEVLTFTVNDNQTRLTAEDNVNIVVLPVNDAPFFTSTPTLVVMENEIYSYSAFADDIENNSLTFAATVLPNWLSFTSEIGLLAGIPTNEEVGQHNITITVTDGFILNPIEQSFVINVINVNNPPEINFPPQFQFEEDLTSIYDFSQYISDIDNSLDELSLSWSGNTNIDIVLDDWEVTFSSNIENWFGEEVVTFYIDDNETRSKSNNLRDISSQSILVNCISINDQPELLNWLPFETDFSVIQDSTITFLVQAEDVDSELNYQWFVENTLIENETESSFVYTFNELGNINIETIISDEDNQISQNWNIQVNEISNTNQDTDIVPIITQLHQNCPNPFNPTTTIKYDLKESAFVQIDIFNTKGQKINSLVNQSQDAGHKSIVWNGTDLQNNKVSSGLYFYKLILNGKAHSMKKCIMLK